MSPEDAFLQSIIDAPDDDTHRLVFADWLDDHGEPERAEFIRVQCELASLVGGGLRWEELRARERLLLVEHEAEWVGLLRGRVAAWKFRRGFVEVISTRLQAFLEDADPLFRNAPIQGIEFQTGMFQLARPHLIFPSAGPLMPQLAVCPHLARLTFARFWHNYMGRSGIEALATSPYLTRLSCLDLSGNDLGDAGVEALAASQNFHLLTSLKLVGNGIGPPGARALAHSQQVSRLITLDLGDNPIGDEGVLALAASPNLSQLTTLGLARSGLSSAGARAMAGSPHLARLKSLDVQDNTIGNKAREALWVRFRKGKCRF